MRRPIIELSNPLIEKELFSRVGFLSFAEGGAMGEPGGVYFFTDDGTLYHLNLMHEDFPYDQFADAFPVIDQCDFGPFGYDSQVPEGWNYVNLGVGNHLLVADRWYEKFIDIVGEDVFPGYMYQTWMRVADQILGNEVGRVSVTREDRIRVFEDTLYWIEDDEELAASVKKAKKNTQVFFENDYPAFDATINKKEVITVTGNKSYQAAMELAKENPGARIAVLNFANAFIPGGGVRKGAGAQEECLCRCSTLYPLLYRRTLRDTFYRHHKDLNSSRASDSMIYTEGVIICKSDTDYPIRMQKKDWVTVDVMTMAAPDLRSKSNRYAPIVGDFVKMSDAALFAYHLKRAIHMLTVAASKGADILVLGAFGCGAFENDPHVVAKAYQMALQIFPKVFDQIEFAVHCSPKDQTNYEVFRDTFDNHSEAMMTKEENREENEDMEKMNQNENAASAALLQEEPVIIKETAKSSINIRKISITNVAVDAIVNAANDGLWAGGGVCGAIFRSAGAEDLTAACKKYNGCKTGNAVITPGFRLPAKYIIHAVGPVWHGGQQNEAKLLYSAYKQSLILAKENGCHSIAFPLISAGIFGYPKAEAWKKAIQACKDFLQANEGYDMQITFAVLDDEILAMGQDALKKFEK